MRKLILILINLLFINAAFAQSYIEPLNKLNNYLQKGKFFVKEIEVKDGYLYIYSSLGKDYEKVTIKDLGGAFDDRATTVEVRCLNDAKCVFKSSIKSKSSYLYFYVANPDIRLELVTLLNNFISSYDKDFGIGYVQIASIGCKSGNCIDGTGNYVYSDSSKYYGEWKNGKRNGKGAVTKMDFTKISGIWENDEIIGKGTINYPNKFVYEGGIKDNLANGEGVLFLKDNDAKVEYKGTFVNGLLNGKGEYYRLLLDTRYEKKEESYIGDFKDGLYAGHGTYKLKTHYPKAKQKGLDTEIIDDGEWKKGKKYDPEEDRVYSLEEKAKFRKQLDTLKAKTAVANAEYDAYKMLATYLNETGDYQSILVNNKWNYYAERPLGFANCSFSLTIKFENRGKGDVYAYIEESLRLPRSFIYNGKLEIVPDNTTNAAGEHKDEQYEGVKYITSKYEAYVIATNGKGLSFQIIGNQFQKGNEILNRGDQFKTIGDIFLGFLDNAKLFVYINASKNFWIQIESKKGYPIIISAPETEEGMKLHNKVNELEKEMGKLKAKIEAGN